MAALELRLGALTPEQETVIRNLSTQALEELADGIFEIATPADLEARQRGEQGAIAGRSSLAINIPPPSQAISRTNVPLFVYTAHVSGSLYQHLA